MYCTTTINNDKYKSFNRIISNDQALWSFTKWFQSINLLCKIYKIINFNIEFCRNKIMPLYIVLINWAISQWLSFKPSPFFLSKMSFDSNVWAFPSLQIYVFYVIAFISRWAFFISTSITIVIDVWKLPIAEQKGNY